MNDVVHEVVSNRNWQAMLQIVQRMDGQIAAMAVQLKQALAQKAEMEVRCNTLEQRLNSLHSKLLQERIIG